MSGFVGAALPNNIDRRSDTRLNRMDFQPEQFIFADIWAVATAVFTNGWWPGTAGYVGDRGLDVATINAVQWGQYDQAAGAASRFGFVGVTRDQWGTAVASCVVKLFRTSDDVLLDTVTSDPSGNFLLNTPYYPDAHYIYSHKTSSPDIDGVTPNTLIAT